MVGGTGWEAILLGTIAQAMPDPIFVLDKDGTYLEVIGGSARSLYSSGDYLRGKRMHDVFRSAVADRFLATVRMAIERAALQIIEYELTPKVMKHVIEDGPTGSQWFQGRVLPFEMLPERKTCVMWFAINITEKKMAEREIRALRGILPICCHCNKVRDDKGYWEKVDKYIQKHTEVDISHSVCPECMEEFYSDIVDDP